MSSVLSARPVGRIIRKERIRVSIQIKTSPYCSRLLTLPWYQNYTSAAGEWSKVMCIQDKSWQTINRFSCWRFLKRKFSFLNSNTIIRSEFTSGEKVECWTTFKLFTFQMFSLYYLIYLMIFLSFEMKNK